MSESNQPQLYRWSRFLLADSDEEFEQLSKEDPIIQTAKNTLEAISADPGTQSLVREREMARRARSAPSYDLTTKTERCRSARAQHVDECVPPWESPAGDFVACAHFSRVG